MAGSKEISTSSSSSSLASPSRVWNAKPPRIQRLVIRAAREKCTSVASSKDEEKENKEEGSPRCVLEENMRSSDSETVSSKASTSDPDTAMATKENPLWKGIVSIWSKKSLRRLSSFPPFGVSKSVKRSNGDAAQVSDPDSNSPDTNLLIMDTTIDHAELQPFFKPSWKNFTLTELRSATNNFSPGNLIGMGGFAEVYKGCLEDGQLVAIKRLTQETADERTQNFLSEIGIIVHVDHPNAARLVGVGVEGGMHLVFELSIHGSLEALLYDSGNKLDWGIRYKIALGAAKGLEYLHDKCVRRIIHRDIKAANILITDNFEPQIGDFGLAKWMPDKTSHLSIATLEGTFGYLAPEYCMHGIVDEKTDVFAYGVLLLELLSGRKAIDSEQRSLAMWAKPLLEHNNIKELIDPALDDSYDHAQMKYVTDTAHMCIQHLAALRPCMSQVIKLLQGEESRSEIMKARRTYSEEIFDAEEYNATRYLNDLRRAEQLALDF